jgi:DNA helicase HerA-like ATPase
MADSILLAKGTTDLSLLSKLANRHGLVAGATGTGKTVTLQRLAQEFSRIGVPVFVADVKGDLSGLCQPGGPIPPIAKRLELLKIADFPFAGSPVAFWDVFGEQGHPVRATISEMGPLLLSRMLNLNEVQSGVLTVTFKVADDNGLLLLDLKDLRAMLQYVGENAKAIGTQYGNVSPASVGAIQRGLLRLEQQGGDRFFGEPALDLYDFVQTAQDGRGVINVLAADQLLQSPQLYATFLLWLLAELFERLPEVGDPPRPKLVFFFDEAHLLFDDAPKELLDRIQQVVRLIRSKGVGVYFVTQNPNDVPDDVLGQLGNRVQHALRAFTPRDQRAVRAAAETFRQNPNLDVEKVITELEVGEALVSLLDEKGTPGIVQRAYIIPPPGRIGPITPDERKEKIQQSVVYGAYEKAIDRESAYEVLKGRAEAETKAVEATTEARRAEFERRRAEAEAAKQHKTPAARRTDTVVESFAKSAARSAATTLSGRLMRGILDTIFGGSRRKR